METKLAFKGDYKTEFGGKSRIWRAFRVFKNGEEIGSLYQEPSNYKKPFRTFRNGFETSGDYIGQFKTRAEALESF